MYLQVIVVGIINVDVRFIRRSELYNDYNIVIKFTTHLKYLREVVTKEEML